MDKQLDALLEGTMDEISILANTSAFINEFIPDVNWVGFYIKKGDTLVLGPFQGRSACVYIPLGKGACGRSAKEKDIIIYDDVRIVENYISCHDETRSEIVIPIIVNNNVYGVLDIDSLLLNRFDDKTKDTLVKITKIIEKHLSKH